MDLEDIDYGSETRVSQKRMLELPLDIDVNLDQGKSNQKRTKSIYSGMADGSNKGRFRDLQIEELEDPDCEFNSQINPRAKKYGGHLGDDSAGNQHQKMRSLALNNDGSGGMMGGGHGGGGGGG